MFLDVKTREAMSEVPQSAIVLRTTFMADVGRRLMVLGSSSTTSYQIVRKLELVSV
jgi:hypothetical protein